MGLSISLETEQGQRLEVVLDEQKVLHRLLENINASGCVCLPFIDWFGDTIFNRLQMKPFRSEWSSLMGQSMSKEEKAVLLAIDGLAKRCEAEPHLYLRFYGD